MGAADEDFGDLLLGFFVEAVHEPFIWDPPESWETRDEEDDGTKQLIKAESPIFKPCKFAEKTMEMRRRILYEGTYASLFIES